MENFTKSRCENDESLDLTVVHSANISAILDFIHDFDREAGEWIHIFAGTAGEKEVGFMHGWDTWPEDDGHQAAQEYCVGMSQFASVFSSSSRRTSKIVLAMERVMSRLSSVGIREDSDRSIR
jgi:hypothetical protein